MATTYRPYPAYQPSGIDWLGDIPTGWKASRVKFQTPFQVGWTPPTGNDENFVGENLWANISDLKTEIIFDTQKRISDSAAAKASMDITPKGSLLYSFKLSVGAVAFAGQDMYTNEAIASFLPSSAIDLRFCYFAFPDWIVKNASENIYGAKILNQELIRNAIILFPSLLEQQQIAAFLDRETAKIDQLIAKQQQLIELLKEKRQAVISHAVTKGVNPDVKMNPSGVEWLGDVPEHWTVCALKHAWHIIDCKHLTAEFVDDGIPLASIREVQAWEVDLTNAKQTTPEFYAQLIEGNRKPEAGDIIYSRNATVGESAKVTEKHPVFSMGQDVCIFKRKSQSTNTDFFLYQIRSQSMQQQLDSLLIGSTFKRINVDNIRNFTVTVPPATEQQAISDFITQQLITFNQLLEKAQRQIELLRERRAALISAAVTGKIDVREVALLA